MQVISTFSVGYGESIHEADRRVCADALFPQITFPCPHSQLAVSSLDTLQMSCEYCDALTSGIRTYATFQDGCSGRFDGHVGFDDYEEGQGGYGCHQRRTSE